MRKNSGLTCILVIFLILYGTLSLYAEWISCDEVYSDCPFGGCDSPSYAANCMLHDCNQGVSVICGIRP